MLAILPHEAPLGVGQEVVSLGEHCAVGTDVRPRAAPPVLATAGAVVAKLSFTIRNEEHRDAAWNRWRVPRLPDSTKLDLCNRNALMEGPNRDHRQAQRAVVNIGHLVGAPALRVRG
jgi:hypothetical protein